MIMGHSFQDTLCVFEVTHQWGVDFQILPLREQSQITCFQVLEKESRIHREYELILKLQAVRYYQKVQERTAAHLLLQPNSRTLTAANAAGEVEQQELSSVAGGYTK